MFWSKKEEVPSPAELQERLQRWLPITAEDIAINRQGRLSAPQQAEYAGLMKQGQKTMLIVVPLVLLITFGALGWMIFGSKEMGGGELREVFQTNPIIPIAGIGGTLLLYVVVVIYAYFRSSNADPSKLKVQSVTGKVKVTGYQAYGVAMGVVAASGAPTRSIMLQVGRKRIYTTNAAVEDAFTSGGKYTIYFIKTSGVGYFVSAEADPNG